jgi:hypothetical protein
MDRMIERRIDPDERACQRLARSVIALAIRDATDVPVRNISERDSARHFLLQGAPGWAEAAGLSSAMIATHYAKVQHRGWPRDTFRTVLLNKSEDGVGDGGLDSRAGGMPESGICQTRFADTGSGAAGRRSS